MLRNCPIWGFPKLATPIPGWRIMDLNMLTWIGDSPLWSSCSAAAGVSLYPDGQGECGLDAGKKKEHPGGSAGSAGGSVSDGDLSGKISRIIMAGHSGGNLERFVDVMCLYMTIEVDISHLSNLAWLILAAEAWNFGTTFSQMEATTWDVTRLWTLSSHPQVALL